MRFAALRGAGAGVNAKLMNIRSLTLAALTVALAYPVAAQKTKESLAKADDPAPVGLEVIPSPVSVDRTKPSPIGSAKDWVTNADYPLDAWRDGEDGVVSYRLEVDRAGKVTECRITGSTATARLNSETCRLLLERARFEPGHDANGQPLAGNYTGFMDWDRREPEFGSSSFTLKIGFTLDETGRSSNCRILERSGDVPADMQRSFEKDPCPASQSSIPVRDPDGRPVARDVVLTLTVESTPAASGGAQPGN